MGDVIEFKKPDKKEGLDKKEDVKDTDFGELIEENRKRKQRVEEERKRKNEAVKRQYNMNSPK